MEPVVTIVEKQEGIDPFGAAIRDPKHLHSLIEVIDLRHEH